MTLASPSASEAAVLSDRDIELALVSDLTRELSPDQLRVSPYDPTLLQPASLDVRLDSSFRVFSNHRYQAIDPSLDQPDLTELIQVPVGEPFVLHPGEFALGATYERLSLGAGLASRFEGKSSLGRIGLITHVTAGFIDPGFDGHVTLELANLATLPLLLWPGMKIGQLCFVPLTSTSARPYGSSVTGSRYQGQRGPTASRSHLGFRKSLPDDLPSPRHSEDLDRERA